jgi:hypothetical protein
MLIEVDFISQIRHKFIVNILSHQNTINIVLKTISLFDYDKICPLFNFTKISIIKLT